MFNHKKYKFINRPELLAPAGNYTKFLAAIENGADAVYMGLPKFNARAMTQNFTVAEYKKAIKYAHLKNAKVYLTLNTLLYDEEIKESLNDIADLISTGLDAVIVQDLGLASAIHSIFPDFPIHASTQMTIYNVEGVKVLESLGFTRVVLARELSIDEIMEIRQNTKIELEVFVHGAACVSYSGNCQLSNFMGHRSGNRGNCAQPCRLNYELFNSSNDRIAQGHLISNKDLYGLPYLKKLAEIGVDSFKIEGRNRTPEYVAIVVNKYKKYLDYIRSNIAFHISYEDECDVMQAFNRGGKHPHYFEGKRGKDSVSYMCAKNWGLPLGEILEIKNNYVKIHLFTPINMHDGVEVLDGGLSGIVTCIKDEKGYLINDRVNAEKNVWIGDFKNIDVKEGSIIYKTSSSELIKKYKETFAGKEHFRKNHLSAVITMKKGEPLTLNVYNYDYNIKLSSTKIVEESRKAPVTRGAIEEKLSKTSNSPFTFSNIICDIDDDSFIPISEVNKLKQAALEKFDTFYDSSYDLSDELEEIKALANKHNHLIIDNINSEVANFQKKDIYIYDYNTNIDYSSYNADRVFVDYSLVLKDSSVLDKFSYIGNTYISLPHNFRGKLKEVIIKKLPEWSKICSGFLIGNLCYFEVFKDFKDVKLIGDYSLNITNNFSINEYTKLGLSEYTLCFEVDNKHLSKLNLSHAIVITDGYTPALTTEFCVVGSFAGGFDSNTACSRPCTYSNNYYLVDERGDTLKILCDNINCSNRILKKYDSDLDLENVKIYRTRTNLI